MDELTWAEALVQCAKMACWAYVLGRVATLMLFRKKGF